MFIYGAVTQRHEVLQTGLCTERGVSAFPSLVLSHRFDCEERVGPLDIYTVNRLLHYTLSLAGTDVHLEWFTMVTAVLRKSLFSPPTSGLIKFLS